MVSTKRLKQTCSCWSTEKRIHDDGAMRLPAATHDYFSRAFQATLRSLASSLLLLLARRRLGLRLRCVRCWMGSQSMPTSCCTVQARNPQQADSSDTWSTQITPANAADARRRCWRPRPAETLTTLTPVFAHMTQLRSPPRNPARCDFPSRRAQCAHTTHALLLAVPCALRSHRLGSCCSRRHRRRSPFGSVVR